MKEGHHQHQRICPRCGMRYSDHPSLSREDNETQICSDCGIREALASLGISQEEQDDIVAAIHRHYQSI